MGASSRPREAARPAAELSLPRLLAAQAHANGSRPFLLTLSGPDAPASVLTFAQAWDQAQRLAGLLRQLRLPPDAPVALVLPNDARACIALTAVMEAGLSALFLPITAPEETMVAALEQASAAALVTVTHCADLAPAERARNLAARLFGLRFVAAFGPDAPDGVIPIDNLAALWASDTQSAPAGGAAMIRTLDAGAGGRGPVRIPGRQAGDLVAAALPVVAATGMQADERILSTMAPDDLAGLAGALVPALMTGMPLVMLPIFDSATMLAEIGRAPGVHLLVPAALEAAVEAAGLFQDGNLASVMVVQRAPWNRARSPLRAAGVPIVDLIALGEDCLCVRERETTARGLPLDAPVVPVRAGLSLLSLAAGPDGTSGRLSVSGRAGTVRDDASGWRALPWRADIADGTITAIHPL